jgi:hypothetical protein
MTSISLNFLETLQEKYELTNLVDTILVKRDREAFERVFACILQYEHPAEFAIANDIFQYQPYGLLFDQRNDYSHLPVIKCWGSRMRIAVLLTGPIYHNAAREKYKRYFMHYPVYHSTSFIHEQYLNSIGNEINMDLIHITKTNLKKNADEWIYLENIIQNHKKELKTYDMIVKFSYNCLFHQETLLEQIQVVPNTLYCQSTDVFYSDAKTFLHVFDDEQLTQYISNYSFEKYLAKKDVDIHPIVVANTL